MSFFSPLLIKSEVFVATGLFLGVMVLKARHPLLPLKEEAFSQLIL